MLDKCKKLGKELKEQSTIKYQGMPINTHNEFKKTLLKEKYIRKQESTSRSNVYVFTEAGLEKLKNTKY